MLTSDHSHFYLDDQPFIPKIFDGPEFDKERGFNISIVKLDATLGSVLDWNVPVSENFVIYELDFGLNNPQFSMVDPMPLATFKQAVDHFSENIVCEKTLGAILYRGEANFAKSIPCKELFEGPHDEPLQEGMFAADLLSDYLHTLAAKLPDNVAPFALMDATHLTNAETALFLSKQRYTHINLGIKGNTVPLWGFSWETGVSTSGYIGHSSFFELADIAEIGLLFPQDKKITPELLRQIEGLLSEFPIRVIPEVMMPENWDGLNGLIAFKDGLTDFGKRVLDGFEATGGRVYTAVSDSALLSKALSEFFPGANLPISNTSTI